MRNAHPPIFTEVLLHKQSYENLAMARRFLLAERVNYPSGKRTLGEVIDGRWATPNRHSEDL